MLTPNRVEWDRLQAQLNLPADNTDGRTVSQLLNGAIVVRKGEVDQVSNATTSVNVHERGTFKRCGGQGDILAGAIGVFSNWSGGPQLGSVAAACTVVRRAAGMAWDKHHRSMISTDVLAEVGHAMHSLYPPEIAEANL